MAGGPLRSTACCALAGLVAAAIAVAGCGSAGPGPASSPSPTHVHTAKAVKSCGTTKTAANVPVRIEVQHGPETCKAAMSVERHYACLLYTSRCV